MAKLKISDKLINILIDGLLIYFGNFKKFFIYMAFPVLGQLLGILWIFGFNYLYTSNLPSLIAKYPVFDNFSTIILVTLIIALPGMFLFMKAFWDFLVAYGALNSMTEAAITTGKIYDFPAYNAVVTRRTFKYIALWLLFSIFTLIAISPLFWIIGIIFFIYFVLIFQVFTFEEDKSVTDCFKRSLFLVKGDFARTFAILTFLAVLTYWLIGWGLNLLLNVTGLTDQLSLMLEGWAKSFPLDNVNSMLATFNAPQITPLDIAKGVIEQAVVFVCVGFTLPLRSITWTLWYKNLSSIKDKQVKNSSKMYSASKKKLDPEILRRAKEKDDQN